LGKVLDFEQFERDFYNRPAAAIGRHLADCSSTVVEVRLFNEFAMDSFAVRKKFSKHRLNPELFENAPEFQRKRERKNFTSLSDPGRVQRSQRGRPRPSANAPSCRRDFRASAFLSPGNVRNYERSLELDVAGTK
jgi:hypothetical protein